MVTTKLIATSYGNAEDVLQFETQELSPLQIGFARIKVKTAGINPIDARRMTGEFRHGGLPQTFGTEFAGEIIDLNKEDAQEFNIGDDVLGSGGSYTHATIIDVPINNLIKKPSSIDWEIAGSIPGVSQTASTILDEIGPIKSLLIHGGSGGVGSITIQLAKLRGIEVLATASARNQEYLKNLGAIPVVYGDGLADRIQALHPEKFDASVDMIGSEEATQTSLLTVKNTGLITTIAGKPVSSSRVQNIWVKRNVNNLKYVVDHIANGKIKWAIDKTFAFTDAIAAYNYILEGHTKGKIVLTF